MNEALDLAVAMIKTGEGCRLVAYPDPVWRGIARTPQNTNSWGKPWTIGYGETLGIREGDVWTQEEAQERLKRRVQGFMLKVLSACPQLYLEPPSRLAACVSLAYNIGTVGFAGSSVRSQTQRCAYSAAGNSFLSWNKARINGILTVMRGLTNRRQHERKVYLGPT